LCSLHENESQPTLCKGRTSDSLFTPMDIFSDVEFAMKNQELGNHVRASVPLHDDTKITGAELRDQNQVARFLVWHPFTGRRIAYDMGNMLLLAYDLVTIPLEAAGVVDPGFVYTVLGAFVTVWWTVDMCTSFCMGFQHKGVVEMRLKKTAMAYLKGWFVLDFVLVMIDWTTLLWAAFISAFGFARGVKSLRMTKIFRLMRLSRVCRLPKVVKHLADLSGFLDGDLITAGIKVFSWVAGILFVNHFIACSWFAIGSATEELPGWVEIASEKFQQNANRKADKAYLYATSLHWSLTQFTPASMEVVPVNIFERVFTIIVMFAALVLFSSFLSSITSEVATYRNKKRQNKDNHTTLVSFLQENRVSLELAGRIQEVALVQQMQSSRVHRIHETDVNLLRHLPCSLKEQLRIEVYGNLLHMHPLFRTVEIIHRSAFAKICNKAMTQEALMPNQDLFTFGKEAKYMYFVIAGEMVYFQGQPGPSSTRSTSAILQASASFEGPLYGSERQKEHEPTHVVKKDEWACEQVLWIKWLHRGLLTARMPCEFALLDSVTFRESATRCPETAELCRRYAKIYTEDLLSKAATETKELTDLGDSRENVCGLISEVLEAMGERDDNGLWKWLTVP